MQVRAKGETYEGETRDIISDYLADSLSGVEHLMIKLTEKKEL